MDEGDESTIKNFCTWLYPWIKVLRTFWQYHSLFLTNTRNFSVCHIALIYSAYNSRSIHVVHSSFFRRYRKLFLAMNEWTEMSDKPIVVSYLTFESTLSLWKKEKQNCFSLKIVCWFLRSHPWFTNVLPPPIWEH